jgi:hypothetical protein
MTPSTRSGAGKHRVLTLAFLVSLWAAACAKGTSATSTPPNAAVPRASSGGRPANARPPAGLAPSQVPLFVVFGFDDNGVAGSDGRGGVRFVNDLFRGRKNPAGRGSAATFDGAAVHFTLYGVTRYIAKEAISRPEDVKREWRAALQAGNELALHTHTHPHGRGMSVSDWEKEIATCRSWMTKPFDLGKIATGETGIGVRGDELVGSRAPFLEYSDSMLEAVSKLGLRYDCSIEEGWAKDQDGTNFVWPYTLDGGSPGADVTEATSHTPAIGRHPGLWELPVYTFVVPPDDSCEAYGVPRGLRARLRSATSDFDPANGKITGMDWNLWFEVPMTKPEFVATVKYSLDLRLRGNRAPFLFGAHSDVYSTGRKEGEASRTTGAERQEALREIVDYVLAKPEVRVVSAKELLGWLERPSPL